MTQVLAARNLTRHYSISRGLFREQANLKAVDGVSFDLSRGKTLAVVGESGCGKSTLARLVTMIERPTTGTLNISGKDIVTASPETLRELRPKVQIVFQNPYGSLNPRQKVGAILEEPLLVNTPLNQQTRTEKARAMMESVGLRPEHYDRYPHMFSGGQRQRIAISCLIPKSWCLMNPFPLSIFPFRPRSSICLQTFRKNITSPTSSSATICQS
jgi:dipeptide transport system ATP-binding protein